MAEVAWKFREVSSSKHTKCCRDKYNLIFPLLRFGALIILLRKTFRYAVNDLVLDWSKNWQVKSCVLMNFIFWLNTKFSRDLFADVMSVHNRNRKNAHAIKFDETNLRAMLWFVLMAVSLIQSKKELKIEVY